MLTIKLCYENDRFTPQPEYVDGQPKLWWLAFDGGIDNAEVMEWMNKPRKLMTALQIEDEVVALGELLGVKDTTASQEWAKHEITIKAPKIVGFVNWPDPGFSS